MVIARESSVAAAPFPMMRLRTEDVPPREQMAFVHDFVARHVGGLQFRPADRDNIRIDLEAMMLPGGLTVGRGFYAPMHGARTKGLLQDGREHYLLTIHNEDHEVSVDGKRTVKVAAGDVLLVNEAVCFEFWQGKPMSVDVLSLDQRRLASLAPRVALEASYVMPATSPSLALLSGYVGMLRRNPPTSVRASEIASRHVYDLAALVLDGFVRGGAERSPSSIAAARLKLVRKDILERLSDPGLGIEAVARRQGITSRYVQRLFETEETTFSDFVREHRLDLAFRMLRERDPASCSITTIAYDAGFSDITTFNRAFRRRFEATPSEVRAGALKG
jgi:AraC-like DNA-binding protein